MRAFSMSLSLMLVLTGALGSTGFQAVSASEPSAKKSKKAKRQLSEKDALAVVAARPEVKVFLRGMASGDAKKRGVSAHIVLDRQENGEYVVHVFEEVPDGKDESHTATFNWYHVNKRSGAVTKEF